MNIVEKYAEINGGILILISGLSGTGKTKLAKNIARDFKIDIINENKYCDKNNITIEGRSAGGLLVGASMVLKPELFKNVVAGVPFVDVLNTMCDSTIPLTVEEWTQWGNPNIKEEDLSKILGPEKFDKSIYTEENIPDVSVGLAWTSVGGDILFIESTLSKGTGVLTITGNLGDVMKESATTAVTFLKANAEKIGINHDIFSKVNVHIHFPEGAVPKDGPSAGITILTSLASLFTQRRVKPFLAMTGEITLRGKVMPVGGIKEKILAAKRAGITTLILCNKNKQDVDEINQDYLKGLTIHYVSKMNEVLNLALLKEKVKTAIQLQD